MKRSLRVMTASALLLLCGAITLSGCSGSTGSSASSPANTASAGAKAAGPDAAKKTTGAKVVTG